MIRHTCSKYRPLSNSGRVNIYTPDLACHWGEPGNLGDGAGPLIDPLFWALCSLWPSEPCALYDPLRVHSLTLWEYSPWPSESTLPDPLRVLSLTLWEYSPWPSESTLPDPPRVVILTSFKDTIFSVRTVSKCEENFYFSVCLSGAERWEKRKVRTTNTGTALQQIMSAEWQWMLEK